MSSKRLLPSPVPKPALFVAPLLILASTVRPAWSDVSPTPAPSATNAGTAATPPDLVRLKNGGMLRGTIIELTPKDSVTISLPTGETRKIPMSDVTYAGPASGATGAATSPPAEKTDVSTAQPMVTVHAGQAKLSLAANLPDVTFHLRSGEATGTAVGWSGRGSYVAAVQAKSYTTICTAPCEATLPTGTHRLGLSHEGGSVVEGEDSVTLTGPAQVRGEYISHRGTRVAGVVLIVGSVAGGAALMLTSTHSIQKCSSYGSCYDSPELNMTQLILGAAVISIGSLVGYMLAFRSDEAAFSITPIGASAWRAPRPVAGLAPDALGPVRGWVPRGLELTARF